MFTKVSAIPPYLFARLDELKEEVQRSGADVIDLGIGDPDLPTPKSIIDVLQREAHSPENHRYPSYKGMLAYRRAVAGWYQKRFGVNLDPERSVLALIGSKEGIAHLPLAFVNPGDVVLMPSPAYPVYFASTALAGGSPYIMPLLRENGFKPDLSAIKPEILHKARIMFLNYPNNPTAAVADIEFFRQAIELAQKYNFIIAHDAAYSEIAYDGFKPLSIMEVEGADQVAVEFHSLSKTFNMTGWRIGSAVGNPEIISGLGSIKTNVDSGVFQAIQYAGIEALTNQLPKIEEHNRIYRERRDVLVEGLRRLGFRTDKPKAAFYIWMEAPREYTSSQLTERFLKKAHVLTTPGAGFGRYGEGYIRFALTVDVPRLREALRRIETIWP